MPARGPLVHAVLERLFAENPGAEAKGRRSDRCV